MIEFEFEIGNCKMFNATLTFRCSVVKDVFLWRDVKKSGIIFGSSLLVFLSFALFSIISVISYFSLAVLTMTASFRIYHLVMATIKKTEATNPFRFNFRFYFAYLYYYYYYK